MLINLHLLPLRTLKQEIGKVFRISTSKMMKLHQEIHFVEVPRMSTSNKNADLI